MACKIVAEIGINHNGDFAACLDLVNRAREVGADAVKFQIFNKFEALKQYELSYDEWETIFVQCETKGIDFFATCFDLPSIQFMRDKQKIWKIPSGMVTNKKYLHLLAELPEVKYIMSTGMCTLEEIRRAVDILERKKLLPYDSILLLHCVSAYPTPIAQMNLNCILKLRDTFLRPAGLSDHSESVFVASAAVAMGAVMIEKHFTLDHRAKGPDHAASFEPKEFAFMVDTIRTVEAAMGDGIKTPQKCEMDKRDEIRTRMLRAC